MEPSLRLSGLMVVAVVALVHPSYAVDHNNIDAGRPLDFDDAQAIAYRERAVELGAGLVKPRGSEPGARGSAEYLYGFAPNSHLSIGLDPQYAAGGGGGRRLDAGDLSFGYFHNLNREVGDTPALAFRADASLPTGRNSRGIDFRLRAIASRHFRQYDRLHFNLDLGVNDSADAGERKLLPGVILGYSTPLGYPTSFTCTLVAQASWRANPNQGEDGIVNLGVGLRQQVSPRSVFDIGLKADVGGGRNREALHLVTGYSTQF